MENASHIHLVGIGGIGLSAIARVLLGRGYRVSGSDQAPTAITEALAREGATIYSGQRAENVSADTALVVFTSAASADNPEVAAAQARGIRVVKRREFLGELTAGYKTIAVAGSHGKTTTTALIALLLIDAGFDPTVIVGGIVPEFGANARAGKGKYFVIEADEYDYAFLGLSPHIAVITNVDYDHPDIFRTRGEYQNAFLEFAKQVIPDGTVIVCGDDADANAVSEFITARAVRYGLGAANDWRAVGIQPNAQGGSDFDAMKGNRSLVKIRTRIPGQHNVLNALAALATAEQVGVPIDSTRATLEKFRGASRRFELRGETDGVAIVDDYAHHPAEIRATLAAARERFDGRELWAIFQPHTFSRTRALLDEFVGAFDDADHVIVTEIYASRERDDLGVSGRDIVERMRYRDARFIPTLDEAIEFLGREVKPGAVVLTLGAGDVNRVGEALIGLFNGDSSRT